MAITRTAWVDDDGSGTTGTIINNAEKTLLYDQIDAYVGGDWVDVAFNAAAFSAVGGTWSVSTQSIYAYVRLGKTLFFAVYVTSTTIGGSPTYLSVTIPGSFVATRQISLPFSMYQGGAAGVGWGQADGPLVKLYRDILGTPWTAGTCHLTGVFPISV